MGIYRFEAKLISRAGKRSTEAASAYQSGTSIVSRAAYRSGEKLIDEAVARTYDYTRKRGVLGSEIILPITAPAWMADRQQLWNAVDAFETRKNAQLAKEYIIALPHELTHEQRVALTRDFVRQNFTEKGLIADIAWHAPSKKEGLNHHCHILVPIRRIEDGYFAKRKDRAPDGQDNRVWLKQQLLDLRKSWADVANKHLEMAGLDLRIDHRSLVDRGIDREPEPKMGPYAAKMERNGGVSKNGNRRRDVKKRNELRQQMKTEIKSMQMPEPNRQLTDNTHDREKRLLHDAEIELRMQEQLEFERKAADERLTEHARQAYEREEEEKKNRAAKEKQANPAIDWNADIANVYSRYALALAAEYDILNPYQSLARAAMNDYGRFITRQEELEKAAAAELDPDKRRSIELLQKIEGCQWMSVTTERIAGIVPIIVGRFNSPQEAKDHENAVKWWQWADEFKQERQQLLEQCQQKEKGEEREKDAEPEQHHGKEMTDRRQRQAGRYDELKGEKQHDTKHEKDLEHERDVGLGMSL
jgi:hypothetical protein